MLYPRNLKPLIEEAATDTPVILLNGARQTGKSTLLSHLSLTPQGKLPMVTLDDLTVLDAIRTSPQTYLAGFPERVILDEVQRAPALFLPLKEAVDRDRKPGRFFLTGSANVFTLPKLADTLAGRMEVVTLWPLSQGELHGLREGFLDFVFNQEPLPPFHSEIGPKNLAQKLLTGGYPEVVQRSSERRQASWFQSYLMTLLQRDVQELSRIEGLSSLPNLLNLLATRTGGLLNRADLSRSLNIPNVTLTRYLGLLEAVYLVVNLQPWFTNLGKRLVKSPKGYLNDTGLLCHLLGATEANLLENRQLWGSILENFVVMELLKQSGWSQSPVQLSHYRTHTGYEVDVILESRNRLVGVEVKAASTVTQEHFKGLRHLQETTNKQFHRGIVLYTGQYTVPFGKQLWAIPLSALWEMGALPAEPLA